MTLKNCFTKKIKNLGLVSKHLLSFDHLGLKQTELVDQIDLAFAPKFTVYSKIP